MWSVVIPFKGAPGAKSRLASSGLDETSREALAEAFLLDVISAVRKTPEVSALTIVAPSASALPVLDDDVRVLREPSDLTGLNAALGWALQSLSNERSSRAIVTGDLPFLTSAELSQVLTLADAHPLALLPDAEGSGTAMLLLRDQRTCEPAFGVGSRAAHEALGFAALDLPHTSGARSDVDTLEQLTDSGAQLGAMTTAVVRLLGLR